MLNLPRALRWTFRFGFICLMIFSLTRLAIFGLNHHVFAELTWPMILHGFFHGVRFDLSIFLVVTGLPLFFLALPFAQKWYFRVVALTAVVLGLLIIFLLFSDIIYFQETTQHIADQIEDVGHDLPFFIKTAFVHYWYVVLLHFMLGVWLVRATWRFAHQENHPFAWWGQLLQVLLTLLVLWMGINGKVGIFIPKMLSPKDAFTYTSLAYGKLVLNAPFMVMRSLVYKSKIRPTMPSAVAEQVVADYVQALRGEADASGVAQPDAAMPLGYQIKKFYGPDLSKTKLNVLFILVESLNAELIKAYQDVGYPHENVPPNVMPNLDQYARQGLLVKSFYPNTRETLTGIEAVLVGFSALPQLPNLGHGLEVSNIMRLGNLFKERGYHTFFAQTGAWDSFWLNTVMRTLGMDDSFSKENYPRLHSHGNRYNGWDRELFAGMAQYLHQQVQTPFFGVLLTGTMHTPYLVPDDKYKLVSHEDAGPGGVINAAHYMDEALGDFMAAIAKESWFKDTLVVITGDHRAARNLGLGRYIPLIFYAPDYLPPQVVDVLSSQVDFIPTLFDMLRWKDPYAGLGRSIFAPGRRMVVQGGRDEIYLLQEREGPSAKIDTLHLGQGKIFQSSFSEEQTAAAEKFLTALPQVLLETVQQQRVCPSSSKAPSPIAP